MKTHRRFVSEISLLILSFAVLGHQPLLPWDTGLFVEEGLKVGKLAPEETRTRAWAVVLRRAVALALIELCAEPVEVRLARVGLVELLVGLGVSDMTGGRGREGKGVRDKRGIQGMKMEGTQRWDGNLHSLRPIQEW